MFVHARSHAHDGANEQLRDGVSGNERSHARGNTTPRVTVGSSWAARQGAWPALPNGSGHSLGRPPHLLIKSEEVPACTGQGRGTAQASGPAVTGLPSGVALGVSGGSV